MRIEKLHLDRAIPASSTELTHVLVHWQRCLQGFRSLRLYQPAGPARAQASSPEPMVTALCPERGPEQPLRLSHNTESQARGPRSQSKGRPRRCCRRSRPRAPPPVQAASAAAGPGREVPPPVQAASAAAGPSAAADPGRERHRRSRPRAPPPGPPAKCRRRRATEQPGHERVEFRTT